MVSLEQILYIIPVLALAASITYYAMVLRNQNKTRQTQMTLQLIESRNDLASYQTYWKIMSYEWDSLDDFLEKYGPQTHPEEAGRIILWSFYDSLGVLVRDNMISADMVYRILGKRIIPMWLKFETTIKWNREREDGPGRFHMEEFEYLAEEMIKISQKKGERLPLHHLHPKSEILNKYT
jgi:hypothetical protein